jgi:hypothetical protein
MADKNQKPLQTGEELEKHPLFPSGEWEGFYTHAFGPHARRHMMSFALTFIAVLSWVQYSSRSA